MILVVDTNIVIAAALRPSVTQELIFNNSFQLYTPEFILEEIEKHEDELLEKSGYARESFRLILSLLFSRITIVPADAYSQYKKGVLIFSPDTNDWPFLALAKHLGAALWSNDSSLKRGQDVIRVLATGDLLKLLKNSN